MTTKRKRVVVAVTLAFAILSAPLSAEALQPKKVPRIGFLMGGSDFSEALRIKGYWQGLRDLGYVEGRNIVVEYRYAEGKSDRLPDLAAELVRLKVDVIVTSGISGTLAARKATSTIPIVAASAGDLVGAGLVASLARPGGNITGLTNLAPDLSGKRLELLKEAIPKVSRVAVLLNSGNPIHPLIWRETQTAAQVLNVKLQSVMIRASDEFESAFATMTKERAGALIVPLDAMFRTHRERIAELAAKSRLPAMGPQTIFVEAGGLMSYGPNFADLYRRAATYVDKILKGTNPADLPVEQPTRFELVINLKTAKQIGLTIPQSMLYRADKVIK